MAEQQISLSELVHPNARQKEFFREMDTHKYTLYGGAKGGGKSYVLRWACVRQLIKWAAQGHLGVRVGLFSEDFPTLKDRQITKIQKEFPRWLGKLQNSQIEGMSFILKKAYGGGVIALRNLDDVSKYASSEFAMIAVEELTKNQRVVFDQFRSILRWPGIEDTKFIAGTNPGEVGHAWVKKIFIDRDLGPEDPGPEQVAFVKSLPTDNPANAKSYIEELERLPEKLRKAYKEGNWDAFEGQYFSEWDRQVHTVAPFRIPKSWPKFRSIDPSGRDGITSCHWYTLNSDGKVYVYREYYYGIGVRGSDGKVIQVGRDYDEHARMIKAMSVDEDSLPEEYRYTVIDTAAFSKAGFSETAAQIYEREGVVGLIASAKERLIGWDAVHRYMRHDISTRPLLQAFSTCVNLIRTLPLLKHDDIHPEDVDSRGEDHAADELRYFLRTLREAKAPKPESLAQRRIRRMSEEGSKIDYSYSNRS